jgi:hypothetical protein
MRARRMVVAMLVLAATAMLPVTRAAAVSDSDIDAQIAAAKTPADHEAIATYYDGKAAEAQAKADEHKKMSAAYKKEGGSVSKTHLHDHCDGLVRVYQSAAKDYRAMADAHRQLAKHASK